MSRTRMIAWGLAALLAVAVVSAPQGAQGAGKPDGLQLVGTPLGKLISGQIGRLMVLRSELNITAEQRAKIRETLLAQKPEMAKTAKAVWEKRLALRHAVLTSPADEQVIRKASDDLGKAIGEAAMLASKLAGEVRPILTSEQRELIKKCAGECEQSTAKFFDSAAHAR